jgi:aminoglycoside phosphotransferase (APT) family kinase protein
VDDRGATAVLRGARALAALTLAGWSTPRSVALRPPRDGGPAVAVETSLGTTDGARVWAALGREGRANLLHAAATALCRLHALPAGVVPGGTVGGWRERVLRCAAEHHGRLADRGDLPDPLLARARAAVDALVADLPSDLALVPCHGAPSLREVSVARRAFAGWRDLETLRLGDPWLDVAYLAFMTDGPESRTPTLVPLLSAYRATGPWPSDLAGRLHLYLLLVTLSSLTDPALMLPPEGCALALDAALAWGAGDALASVA